MSHMTDVPKATAGLGGTSTRFARDDDLKLIEEAKHQRDNPWAWKIDPEYGWIENAGGGKRPSANRMQELLERAQNEQREADTMQDLIEDIMSPTTADA